MQDRIKNNFGKLVKRTFPGFGPRSYLMLVPPTKMFCFGMSKLFLSYQKMQPVIIWDLEHYLQLMEPQNSLKWKWQECAKQRQQEAQILKSKPPADFRFETGRILIELFFFV